MRSHDLSRVIFSASVRGFEPATASKDESTRKKELKDEILKQVTINPSDRESCCRADRLFIDVKFFLYSMSGVRGRTEKDLDNLLKIFCDVLPDYMDNVVPPAEGLGLIKSDNAIFEIHCSKSYVDSEEKEGMDFKIEALEESSDDA